VTSRLHWQLVRIRPLLFHNFALLIALGNLSKTLAVQPLPRVKSASKAQKPPTSLLNSLRTGKSKWRLVRIRLGTPPSNLKYCHDRRENWAPHRGSGSVGRAGAKELAEAKLVTVAGGRTIDSGYVPESPQARHCVPATAHHLDITASFSFEAPAQPRLIRKRTLP
jgi:hypothetical protein